MNRRLMSVVIVVVAVALVSLYVARDELSGVEAPQVYERDGDVPDNELDSYDDGSEFPVHDDHPHWWDEWRR